MSRQATTGRSPSDVLIGQLGLTRRTRAEVQDMYSRPIRTRLTVITPVAPDVSTALAAATFEPQAA